MKMSQLTEEFSSHAAPDITPIGLAISTIPVLLVLLISLYLRLGNVQVLIIASVRCVAQLMLLGLILYPVFVNNQPYVVLPYIFVMLLFATREASVKPKHNYIGMRRHMLLSLTVGVSISFAVISGLVLKPQPWWNASTMIPLCGMLMGSSVNALSLGMDKLLLSLSDSGSARMQTLLACGATTWEAALPSVREAIETGLTPNLNQMSIMGLVSIPGMMAGQILGGASPLTAAKYQVVIMFFICSNSTTVLFGTILQAVFWRLFDGQARFLKVVAKRKGGKPKDILMAFGYFVCGVLGFVKEKSNDGEDCRKDSDEPKQSFVKRMSLTKSSKSGASSGERNNEERMKQGTFISGSRPSIGSKLLHIQNGEIVFENSLHLSSLEVVVNEGDIVLIKGESGCGKSTLLRSLALLEPLGQASSIEYKGKPVDSLGTPLWRSEVCYIRQSGGQGLRGTPIDLLNDLCHLDSQQHRSSLEKCTVRAASVETAAQNMLQSLDLPSDILLQRWDELSGGESQRVYLCIVIALQPSICLLDEPTSALDDHNSKLVEKLLLDSGITLVWVTHSTDQVQRLEENSRTSILEYRSLNSVQSEHDTEMQL